ncbi:MAG: putative S-layer protein [Candidatus Pacearchaeota archaeon]|nr:putative S-layer protein [Candidatus Pacearchaeota archaeon]
MKTLMVVKATITNTGNKIAYYTLNAAGYTGWADSATLDKSSLTLNAGESGEVLLNFDVKKEALGINLFNLEVLSENKLIVNQPVQVEITKRKLSLGNLFSGNNGYIWGIGLLNLILIILIIVIAVRIARK